MPFPFLGEKVVAHVRVRPPFPRIVDNSFLALVAVRETTVSVAHATAAIAVVCTGGVFALSTLVFINGRSSIFFR